MFYLLFAWSLLTFTLSNLKIMEQVDDKQDEGKTTAGSAKSHQRSASYPILTLQEALDYSGKIYNKFAASSTVTRAEISRALEVHENTVSRDIAACVQYGLFSKSPNEGYKLTELFTNQLNPESQKEKKLLLLKAFGTPKLFQELINKFDGLPIPEEFQNTLVRHHGITANAAKLAAEVFMESGKFVGAISENRVLSYKVTISTIEKTNDAEFINSNTQQQQTQVPVVVQPPTIFESAKLYSSDKDVPIHLTDDKLAIFRYPSDITEDDIEIIEMQIKVILHRVKLENKKKKAAEAAPES